VREQATVCHDPDPARWSDEGEPLNLEAAIADAIEWMVVASRLPLSVENRARLYGAMHKLAAYGDPKDRAMLASRFPLKSAVAEPFHQHETTPPARNNP
jgi:hypothetical protein